MLLDRGDLHRFSIGARVWVEYMLTGDPSGYVTNPPLNRCNRPERCWIVKPLAALPPAFLSPEVDARYCWTPPSAAAEHGHFAFFAFACPAMPVFDALSSPASETSGRWDRWYHAEMLLTDRGIRFCETGWPARPYEG